jgi:hypothetical protein
METLSRLLHYGLFASSNDLDFGFTTTPIKVDSLAEGNLEP